MGANAALRSREAGLDPGSPDFLSSHPATPERVSNAIMQARQYTGPGAGARDRDAYLDVIDGLIYGEDPSDGFVRGRRFTHPKLGFTFTAPAGFELENVASAVFGVKDGGAQAMRLDVARVPPDQALDDYLRSGWIENVDTASVRALTVNGLPAATATAQGEGWTFRLYAIRFGEDVYRFIFAARQKSDAIDRSFAGSVEHIPPHHARPRRRPRGRNACASSRCGLATRWSVWRGEWAPAPGRWSDSGCSTASIAGRQGQPRRPGQDRDGMNIAIGMIGPSRV